MQPQQSYSYIVLKVWGLWNIKYQIQAIESLRKGIEEYDRRHGWRGPITNKIKNKDWNKKIKSINLDPTLNWELAEIIGLSDTKIDFKIINKKNP